MIHASVSIDTTNFDRMMSDIPNALARARQKALRYIGQAVASRTTRAFRNASLRPSPWAPRKDTKAKHPLLIKSGSLRQSFAWRVTGPDAVQIGTDRAYASYHQQGTKKMPARPFYPVDRNGNLVQDMKDKIDRNLERIYMEELEKTGG